MNNLITEIFTFLLSILHIIFLIGLGIFLFFGGEFTYIPIEMRIIFSVLFLILYIVIFGVISTIVTTKDQMVEINKTNKLIDKKISTFFTFMENEVNRRKDSKDLELKNQSNTPNILKENLETEEDIKIETSTNKSGRYNLGEMGKKELISLSKKWKVELDPNLSKDEMIKILEEHNW